MPFPRSFTCVFMYLVNKSFLIGHLLRTRQCAMHGGAAFSEERGVPPGTYSLIKRGLWEMNNKTGTP